MGSLLLTLIYICFVSLGLPDSLLGSMWPVLHTEISVPVSFAGTISMPTLFGLIVDYISVSLLPVFILGLLLLISVMHELVTKRKIISSNMAKSGDELM